MRALVPDSSLRCGKWPLELSSSSVPSADGCKDANDNMNAWTIAESGVSNRAFHGAWGTFWYDALGPTATFSRVAPVNFGLDDTELVSSGVALAEERAQ